MQKSLDEPSQTCYTVFCSKECATVAQQVEQLTRNEQVVRSNRIGSSMKKPRSFERGFFNDIRSLWSRMIYLRYDIHLRWMIYALRM